MERCFGFEVLANDAATPARTGILHTAHGSVETPVFMPVGTRGTVKSQTQEMLEQLEAHILLANAYHLYLRPGHELIQALGGLHRFMAWNRAILTDSGGFQIYSLAPLRKLSDEGVQFQSHLDGSWHFLTPETVIDIQVALGSDIIMVLDECQRNPTAREAAETAVALTSRWASRCRQRFQELEAGDRQALFGVVQGSTFLDLRQRSLEALVEIGFDGYAIGGLSVGETPQEMYRVLDLLVAALPWTQPAAQAQNSNHLYSSNHPLLAGQSAPGKMPVQLPVSLDFSLPGMDGASRPSRSDQRKLAGTDRALLTGRCVATARAAPSSVG